METQTKVYLSFIGSLSVLFVLFLILFIVYIKKYRNATLKITEHEATITANNTKIKALQDLVNTNASAGTDLQACQSAKKTLEDNFGKCTADLQSCQKPAK